MRRPPLWMPAGSVRAILALLVVGGTVAMWVLQRPLDPEQDLVTAAVIGGYFAIRVSEARR